MTTEPKTKTIALFASSLSKIICYGVIAYGCLSLLEKDSSNMTGLVVAFFVLCMLARWLVVPIFSTFLSSMLTLALGQK